MAKDDMPLADAARDLGLAQQTLASQARRGKLKARKVGPIWMVSRREVERYRLDHKDRPGRRSIGQP
jgi:hypothetical protein